MRKKEIHSNAAAAAAAAGKEAANGDTDAQQQQAQRLTSDETGGTSRDSSLDAHKATNTPSNPKQHAHCMHACMHTDGDPLASSLSLLNWGKLTGRRLLRTHRGTAEVSSRRGEEACEEQQQRNSKQEEQQRHRGDETEKKRKREGSNERDRHFVIGGRGALRCCCVSVAARCLKVEKALLLTASSWLSPSLGGEGDAFSLLEGSRETVSFGGPAGDASFLPAASPSFGEAAVCVGASAASALGAAAVSFGAAGVSVLGRAGDVSFFGSAGVSVLGGAGGVSFLGSGGVSFLGSGGVSLGLGGVSFLGSGGASFLARRHLLSGPHRAAARRSRSSRDGLSRGEALKAQQTHNS
ncbi:hypothetical protein Efla_007806 [Eimeria flavescens]